MPKSITIITNSSQKCKQNLGARPSQADGLEVGGQRLRAKEFAI
jgi:hypothetical protein